MRNEILAPIPHRQYVFTIPKILRIVFRNNRRLLTRLSQCARDSLVKYLRMTMGIPEGKAGIISVIQTFGDYARWHPHIHALAADGLFTEKGTFHVMPEHKDIQPLEELFRANILNMLCREGGLSYELAQRIMKWKHTSGFSVHNRVRIKRDDDRGRECLAQYISRNAFSVKKITYDSEKDTVTYRSSRKHVETGLKYHVFDAVDFIAAVTQHIPEKSSQMIRYYGWYSNKSRGCRLKKASSCQNGTVKPESVSEEDRVTEAEDVIRIEESAVRKKIPSPKWRECIRKIWEVDPLECPECGSEMKIISFIDEPPVVEKILKHLKLWRADRSPPG